MLGFSLNQAIRNPKINQMNSLEENKRANDYINSFVFKDSKYMSDTHQQTPETYYGVNSIQLQRDNFFMIGSGKNTGVGIYNKKRN